MGVLKVADATPEGLLDREQELGVIASAVTVAGRRGDGRALLLRGPAGIGKTSLLRAGAGLAADRGLVVLGARGSELEADFGFGVVRQLFASVPSSSAEEPGVLDGATALAAPVLGVEPVADAGRGPSGPDAAFAKLEALTRVTGRLAASSGLALFIDDAHWADTASLRFFAYLARRIADMPVALILAARDNTEVGAAAVDAILADSEATTLELHPLSAKAAERLVRTALPEAGETTCRACHAVTGGNPLFLSELIRTLRGRARGDAADVLAVVPASVVEAIRDRLRRLRTPAGPLATAVAVLGDGALLRHAATVAGIAHEDAVVAADDLVRAGILRAERPLRFLHPLLRSAAHELLLPGERAAAHALAADLLSAEEAEPELVAAHLLACEPRGHARACHWLCAAADEAMHRGAPDAAATYLTRALQEPPPAGQRAQIHLLLGEALALTRHPGAAADHLRRGIAGINDPRRKLHAATLLAGMLAMDGRGEDAVQALDEALAQCGHAGADDVGVVEAHLLNVTRYDILTRARCLKLGRRVRDRARLTPPGTGVELTAAAAEEAMAGHDSVRTAALALQALARLEAEGAFPGDYTAFTAARSLIMADAFDAAERCLGRALASARAHGATVACASILALQCELHHRRGALVTAAACGQESLQTAHDGWATGIPAVSAALGCVLIELDDLDGAQATIKAALAHSSGSAYPTTMLLLARGRLHLARGQSEAAVSDLLEVGRRQAQAGELNPTLMEWRSLAAEALATLGRTAQAAALAEEELQLARRFGAPRALGNALRVAGIVAGAGNETRRLREAVDVLNRSPAQLTRAYAQADLGTALGRAGRTREARIVLRHALDTAHACGGALLERRALAELRSAGGRPRRASLRGVDALTVSERRIADLAALGLSNHEIAGRLVVSVRTVEFHLSGTFRKLGIGSRRELTSVLAGHAEARSSATNLG